MAEWFLLFLAGVYVAGLGSGATLSVVIWSWCQMSGWRGAAALMSATILWPILLGVLVYVIRRDGSKRDLDLNIFQSYDDDED